MTSFNITITDRQRGIIIDAINKAEQSNKRMQQTKPEFRAVFDTIAGELTELKTVLLTARSSEPPSPTKTK